MKKESNTMAQTNTEAKSAGQQLDNKRVSRK